MSFRNNLRWQPEYHVTTFANFVMPLTEAIASMTAELLCDLCENLEILRL